MARMTREYVPRLPDRHERAELLASFGPMTRDDQDALALRLAENGISLAGLRTALSAPKALRHALDELRVQRPFGGFRDYARHGYGHYAFLENWLETYGMAYGLFDSRIRHESRPNYLGRLGERLSSETRVLHGRRNFDKSEEPTAEDRLAQQTVVIPYILRGRPSLNVPALVELLKGSFAHARLHFDWNPDQVKALSARIELGACNTPTETGIELLRFGLIETSYGQDERTLEALRAKLPPGARFAGLEALAAVAAYPRLLGWMNSDPDGGSGVAEPMLWLPGLGAFGDDPERPEYLRMNVGASGPFRLPQLGPAWLSSWPRSDEDGRDLGFVPYVVPVRSYTPSQLTDLVLATSH